MRAAESQVRRRDVRALKRMGERTYTAGGFTLVYDGFVPEEERLREALTSTGNGYVCIRGSAEWEDAGDVHSPGTYAHGVYNRESTILGRRPIPNEDLVNLPRCWSLKLCLEGEEPVRLANVLLLSYSHSYDVRHAMLTREVRFRDRAGRDDELAQPAVCQHGKDAPRGTRVEIVPENWSGRVQVLSALDGRVLNRGVARYQQLWGRHLDPQGPRIHAPRCDRAQDAHADSHGSRSPRPHVRAFIRVRTS